MTDKNRPGLDTLALHAGHVPDTDTLSRAVPIYQTSSYLFRDAQHASNLFELKEFGYIYSRLMNPTTDVLEKRLAALFGGTGAVCFASGMSAISSALLTIVSTGQNIVTGSNLYGGTVTLFAHTFKRLGIEVRFVDSSDPKNFAAAIDGNTRLLYSESVGNPRCNVDDLAAIADVAHAHNLPFFLDCTSTPPPIFDPFKHGVDVAVCSLTKIIGGHGTSLGGAAIEKGDFDWTAGNYPEITAPDESYHGVNFWECFGNHDRAVARGLAFSLKLRCGILRDMGGCISPFNSFQIIQGVETLPLRARRHCENAQKVAEFLAAHPAVSWVNYAGLSAHPDHANAKKYFPLGPSAVYGFGVKGGKAAGMKFIESVKLCSHLANILDARTLVIHPASTTHQQLSPEELEKAGVPEDLVRLSVGLEDVKDICADLDQALRQSQR
jgi:O-acetylhomoserine (thiol)-lyase